MDIHEAKESGLTRKGNELQKIDKAHVLAAFVHRYTGEHKPDWAKQNMPNGNAYKPHYKTDAEWLANTEFAVKKNGLLDGRVRECHSTNQTWPEGK